MFFQFTRFFRGYLKICLIGCAPERFFNLCASHDILIWDLAYSGTSYECYMSLPAFRTIRPLLRKTHTRIYILERHGLPFFLFRYRHRKTFFFGLFLCVFLLYYSSHFIWCIEIGGNTIHSYETMLRYLASQGCYSGARIDHVDCSALEEQMRIDYPDIIWVSIRKEGTRLYVEVKENLSAGEKQNAADLSSVDTPFGYDILAQKAGVIDHIITRKGTPCITAGDTVEAGTLLVSGTLPLYNDAQEVYQYDYTVADADVYLACSYEYEDTFDLSYCRKEYTGRKRVQYEVKLLSFHLSIPPGSPPTGTYESSASSQQLCLLKNLYLPLWLEQKTYLNYKSVTETYTPKMANELAKMKFQSFLADLAEKDVEILEKNVIIDIVNHSCQARGSVKVIEKTGIYQRTKEINIEEGQATDEFN